MGRFERETVIIELFYGIGWWKGGGGGGGRGIRRVIVIFSQLTTPISSVVFFFARLLPVHMNIPAEVEGIHHPRRHALRRDLPDARAGAPSRAHCDVPGSQGRG